MPKKAAHRRPVAETPPVPPRVAVVGICHRAGSGESRPWLVEGDDGHYYFLKKDNVTADRLAMGYLMGRLAEECGLPVPPIRLLELPSVLLAHSAVDEVRELTPGTALGSLRVPFAEEIRTAHLQSIDETTKVRCLCFDWWTRNGSRRLDRIGGDPNALWDPVLQQVCLIDHDGCFDANFDAAVFKREHAFRDMIPFLEKDALAKWRTRFESAVYHLARIWEEMPPAWVTGKGRRRLLSFTRQELEAKLMKPKLAVDGLLPTPAK